MREPPILAFARDFSGNDATVVAEVQAHLATPPSDERVIGFYGSGDYAPRTRVFLATVSLLVRRGFFDSVEDKYTIELLQGWRDKGVIDVAALPAAAKAVFGPILDPALGAAMGSPENYVTTCWAMYAKATEDLESQIAAGGRVLLSVDATEGDTLFFALAAPDVAARWRGKALSDENGYCAGVRPPMWDRFWDHLTYFSGLMNAPGQSGYPPGTRLRETSLPLME